MRAAAAPLASRAGSFPTNVSADAPPLAADRLPDLKPARWIWYPSGRCLANTFVLFRRVLDLPSAPLRATGWISADSRYLLEVNGQRVQWGPAPCDPRSYVLTLSLLTAVLVVMVHEFKVEFLRFEHTMQLSFALVGLEIAASRALDREGWATNRFSPAASPAPAERGRGAFAGACGRGGGVS